MGIHLPGSLEGIASSGDPLTWDPGRVHLLGSLECIGSSGSTYLGSQPRIGSCGDPLTLDPGRALEVVGIHLPWIPAVYWK